MATTTNFGWTTPDDTDLVKDGAAAIRTLGSAIDASLVDLKGGTTGQVLAKASNADLDYTWSNVDPLTILDAKGDLISATAADTPARLAVGTNGQYLQADSTTATGLKWAAVATDENFSLLNSGGTALTGAQTITVSGISNKNCLFVILVGASSASVSSTIYLRLNTDTGNNYYYAGWQQGTEVGAASEWPGSGIQLARMSNNAGSAIRGGARIDGCNTAGSKMITGIAAGNSNSGSGNEANANFGYYNSASTISSISVFSSSGNFDAGTLYVFGA